jgi:hypothetical protein
MCSDDDWRVSGLGDLYSAHVSTFLNVMPVLRREFGGYVVMILILAIIGDRRIWQQASSENMSYEGLGETPLADSWIVSINALFRSSPTSVGGPPKRTTPTFRF